MADKTILRVLADGELANSLQPLYAVNNDVSVEVHQIILVNKDSSSRTVNVYVLARQASGGWGAPRLITPSGLIMDAGDLTYVLDDPIQLNMSDQIFGYADVGSKVDFLITGKEYSKSQVNEIVR